MKNKKLNKLLNEANHLLDDIEETMAAMFSDAIKAQLKR